MKYGFIRDHAAAYPVNLLCRMLGVQRSAYYDWRDRPGQVIPPEEPALRRRMKALFKASRESLAAVPWRASCVRKALRLAVTGRVA